jgi:hypothetical protein
MVGLARETGRRGRLPRKENILTSFESQNQKRFCATNLNYRVGHKSGFPPTRNDALR